MLSYCSSVAPGGGWGRFCFPSLLCPWGPLTGDLPRSSITIRTLSEGPLITVGACGEEQGWVSSPEGDSGFQIPRGGAEKDALVCAHAPRASAGLKSVYPRAATGHRSREILRDLRAHQERAAHPAPPQCTPNPQHKQGPAHRAFGGPGKCSEACPRL